MAEALYRKYRPQVFEDVVGQEPIERTLKNALERDQVSHAYLFCGPRGTGKTTIARLLAKALLCENGPTPYPDGTCDDCQMIAEGIHPDVYELDAASRTGVDNVREEIISRVQFAPTRGRSKVYIIDEVHMLSVAAFNALLKTLEEPPAHVVFILCTTDPQKVPETIHSRCQRFDFRRIAPESMVSRLGAVCVAEDVEFEGEALDLIAQRADGGLRNALTALEQIIAFENGKVTLEGAERLLGSIDSTDMAEIIAYIGKRDVANCFRWTADYVETGADLAQFVRDMSEHVRNMYVMSLAGTDVGLDINETTRRELAGELQWYGPERLARFLGVLGDLMADLKTSSNPRLSFEIALTRLVRPDSDLTIDALAERVEALESGYSAVAHVLPGEPVVPVDGPAPSVAPAPVLAPEPVTAVVEKPKTQVAIPAPTVEPEPEPAPAPTPAAKPEPTTTAPVSVPRAEGMSERLAAALANPAALQRLWQSALANVKRQKAAYGALFMNTKVRYDESRGIFAIDFPTENTFAYRAVQKSEVREAIQRALDTAAGEPLHFDFFQMAANPTASTPQVKATEVPARSRRDTASKAAHEFAPNPEPTPAPTAAPAPAPAPAYDASYDQVPYEDVPYEEVPLDAYGYAESTSDIDLQLVAKAVKTRAAAEAKKAAMQAASQVVPTPAPQSEPAPEPEPDNQATFEAVAEQAPEEIAALLQAGFGGAVLFEEIDE